VDIKATVEMEQILAAAVEMFAILRAKGEGIMFYKVSDVSIEYEPDDEIIADHIEAADPDAAIIAALKAISPSMEVFVAEAIINQPDEFAKHVLSAFVAEEV